MRKTVVIVPAAEFVVVWQTSSSVQEVCKKLGMRRGYASVKAWELRKKGVPLKKFPFRGPSKTNIEYLRHLAETSLRSCSTLNPEK